MSYLCPRCEIPTEDYAAHVDKDREGNPCYPFAAVTGWQSSPTSPHAHATRMEREGSGRFSRPEYRFGIIADRYCPACETVMPHSVCEYR